MIRNLLIRLQHRRADKHLHGATLAACTCGWQAQHAHWTGSLSTERDWQQHLAHVKRGASS